jgi:hypothetical protein
MGGKTLTVESDELRSLSTTMFTTADELDRFADVRGEYARELGDDDVAGAVSGFFQHWSDGIHRMSADVRGIGDRLQNAADAYDAVECSIADQATPGGGGGGW